MFDKPKQSEMAKQPVQKYNTKNFVIKYEKHDNPSIVELRDYVPLKKRIETLLRGGVISNAVHTMYDDPEGTKASLKNMMYAPFNRNKDFDLADASQAKREAVQRMTAQQARYNSQQDKIKAKQLAKQKGEKAILPSTEGQGS